MKGLLLAGGTGSRMRSLTKSVNKHLLPVFDQPLIHYSLSFLIEAGFDDIVVVTDPQSIAPIRSQLGNGEQFQIELSYEVQDQPLGLAHAILCARPSIGDAPIAVMLGDNLFIGNDLPEFLSAAKSFDSGASLFAIEVDNPCDFGVIEFDGESPVAVIEKPIEPRSNWAIPGFYLYDSTVWARAERLIPSARGEYEITDLNQSYLHDQQLHVTRLPRSVEWFDAGTPQSLFEAGQAAFKLHQSGAEYGLSRFGASDIPNQPLSQRLS